MAPDIEPFVQLQRVSKSYRRGGRDVTVLRSADLTVGRGEFVAVMGPSGSGKSTLLQIVGGLDLPSAGTVRVAEQRLDAMGESELARFRLATVGILFQFHNLIPTLSATENAALPLMLANTPRREALARAESLLTDLGLQGRLNHFPDELSGGEVQRISLARGIITRPPLLLADEPTGNLDSLAGEEVMQLIRRVPRTFGLTVLMVTHDARAAAYADRVVVLRNGALVETGYARSTVS